MSNSSQPHGLQPTRLFHPWDFPGKKKDVLFIIGDWNAKAGTQKIPEVTGTFGLGAQNEVGKMLTEFCQENALVIQNTLFQHHKR